MRNDLEGAKPYLLLTLWCLCLFLPGLMTLPPIDRDEARFAQATRQMIESGDFVRIRFQEVPRHKKPIGIYWLQAAAVTASGVSGIHQIWPYRIPSVLGAVAAVLFTFAFGKSLFDRFTALLGAGLLAASLLLVVEAHFATTDAVLLAAIVVAQGALWEFYARHHQGHRASRSMAVAFWLAQGLGILVKGPIVPLVSILTIGGLFAADRSVRWLKGLHPGMGLILVTAITAPWAIAIGLATHGAFFHDAVGGDLLPKLISGQESHGFPPGYYLLLLPVTFWPGSLLVGPAVARAWKARSWTAERFCLAWIVPAWLLFELIPTKLPHYILPTYPALALLTARVACTKKDFYTIKLRSRLIRSGFVMRSLIGPLIAGGMVALPFFLEHRWDPVALGVVMAATAAAVGSVWCFFQERYQASLWIAALGAFLVLAPTLHAILPNVNALWLSRSTAEAVKLAAPHSSEASEAIAAAGYHEPSLVFLLGTETKLVSPEQAADLLHSRSAALAVISDKEDEEFRHNLADLNASAELLRSIRGYNYSKGRSMILHLYRLAAGPAG